MAVFLRNVTVCFLFLLFISYSADTTSIDNISSKDQLAKSLELWNHTRSISEIEPELRILASISDNDQRKSFAALISQIINDCQKYEIRSNIAYQLLQPYLPQIIKVENTLYSEQTLLSLVQLIINAGHPKEALDCLNPFLQKSPLNPKWLALKFDALIGLERFDDLISEAGNIIRTRPGTDISFFALSKIAESKVKQQLFNEAIACYNLLLDVSLIKNEFEAVSRGWMMTILARDGTLSSVSQFPFFSSENDPIVLRLDSLPFQVALLQDIERFSKTEFRERAIRYLYAAKPKEALSTLLQWYHRLDISMKDLDTCLLMTANTLRAAENNPDIGQMFLLYYQYGANGKDGIPNTADDLKNPLPKLEPISAEELYKAHLRILTFLHESPTSDVIVDHLIDYASVLSSAGELQEALSVARGAFAVAKTNSQLDKSVHAVASALRLYDGHIQNASKYIDFQRFGPAGQDKKLNTKDDLQNPLNDIPLVFPSIFEERIKEWIKICEAEKQWRYAAVYQLVLSNPKEALSHFKKARSQLAFQPDKIIPFIAEVSAALKAVDGYCISESPYLLFQKHGAAGPDGKLGTADDLVDPLEAY